MTLSNFCKTNFFYVVELEVGHFCNEIFLWGGVRNAQHKNPEGNVRRRHCYPTFQDFSISVLTDFPPVSFIEV